MTDLEANKAVVRTFLDTALNQRDPERAVAECLDEAYVQHNPLAVDGSAGFVAWSTWKLGSCPELRFEFKRLIAEGDLVASHAHVIDQPGDAGVAVVDIFRVVGGRLVEHWDVIQPVPETARNDNGMF